MVPPRGVTTPTVSACKDREPVWPQIQQHELFAIFATSLLYSSITARMESGRCRKTANNVGSVLANTSVSKRRYSYLSLLFHSHASVTRMTASSFCSSVIDILCES